MEDEYRESATKMVKLLHFLIYAKILRFASMKLSSSIFYLMFPAKANNTRNAKIKQEAPIFLKEV